MNIDSSILNTFITLVVSVGIIWIILLLVKKYTVKLKKGSSDYSLNVIAKISLQPKSHLFVVEAGRKKLLIGVAEKNINLISDLSETSASAKQNQKNKIKDPNQEAIDQYLNVARKAAGISQHKNTKADPADDNLSFRSFIKSTLKKNSN